VNTASHYYEDDVQTTFPVMPSLELRVGVVDSVIASLKMNGTDLWNVSSGVEFNF